MEEKLFEKLILVSLEGNLVKKISGVRSNITSSIENVNFKEINNNHR